jgi:hypothetical protein
MRLLFLASLGLLATASACTTAVPGRQHAAFWRTNGYDRQGEQQGRWRTYFDAQKQTRFTTGRYRHGRPVGHWRYYTQLGGLDHEERYRRDYSDIAVVAAVALAWLMRGPSCTTSGLASGASFLKRAG